MHKDIVVSSQSESKHSSNVLGSFNSYKTLLSILKHFPSISASIYQINDHWFVDRPHSNEGAGYQNYKRISAENTCS